MSVKSSSFLGAVHAVRKSDQKKVKKLPLKLKNKTKVKPLDLVVKDIKYTPSPLQKLLNLFTLNL